MEQVFLSVLDKISEHGVFAVLFFILLAIVGYIAYRVANAITANVSKNMDTIVASNSRFADSSEKMVDLIDLLVKQTEATSEQLKFIKKNMQKQNMVLADCIRALEDIIPKDNHELEVRLNDIVKEIQRPVES